MFAVLAVYRWIERQTSWSIRKFARTARRHRNIERHGTPCLKPAEPNHEGGRGLMLVDALCERWDWDVPAGWTGKVVWAVIAGERVTPDLLTNPGQTI